ncbi:MAG: hypothetical protein JWO20_2372 [Candidatus Angelobacter sp.]|nr:hypothetical protein [Candidatus Angelobacter sp.]
MKSRLLAFALFTALYAAPAFAQGCATCRDNAAAAPLDTQRSLRRGIIVLLVPSLGAVFGLMGLAYRERNQFDSDPDDSH